MANILQVTSPETNIESNQGIRTGIQTGGGQVGNAGRVQIQPKGQNADAAAAARGESAEAADFESNYAAFLTKLQASDSLPEELTELLFHDGEVLLQSENSEIAGLMQELFAGIEMESPEDLLQFMQSQTDGQMKFSGTFFDGIRNILKEDISGPYQEAVMRFIRSYNSYTSGSHLLNQLHTLGQQASGQMLKAYRGNFENLLDRMNWMAENGDREANTRLLNNEIIPFLSKYISRTHDYGAIRRTAVLFSLYSVKYEEGSEKELVSAFRRLSRNSDFRALFDGDPEKALVKKLAELRERESGDGFSDAFSQLLLKGAQGRTGSESVSRYYQVLNSLLLHESAYMPLLHMLLPFRYQNRNVMSEMWVNPDADKESNAKGDASGQSVKLFLKFRIDRLGSFDMIGILKNNKMKMQLFVPDTVKESPRTVENAVAAILKRNGLSADVTMSPKVREISVQEVFPEIREEERSINVSV